MDYRQRMENYFKSSVVEVGKRRLASRHNMVGSKCPRDRRRHFMSEKCGTKIQNS